MSPASEHNAPALLESLESVRRKAKTLGVLRGFGVVIASAVGLLLAVILLDYLLNLRLIPRMVIVAVALIGLGRIFWLWVAKPARARLTLSDMAGHVENVFPQFEDRLRSTVDFVRTEVPGSSVMKDRTMRQASDLAAGVDLDRALVRRPVVNSAFMACGAVAVLIALVLLFPDLARPAFNRLLGGTSKWPQSVEIAMMGTVPQKVPAGQPVVFKMRLKKGGADTKAKIYYQYDDGPVQQQIMHRNDDGTYAVSVDARARNSMRVWMEAGDDETQPQVIAVVPRLAIARVEARITPPPYAKLPPTSANLTEAPASVTVGSNIELAITFNKPLDESPVRLEALKADMRLPQLNWKRPQSSEVVTSFTATQTIRFKVHATDTDKFTNSGVEEFEIAVRPDQLPSVMIENPRGPEERTPNALVRLEALAEDDFDIATMTLIVDRLGDKKHWEIPLAGWEKVDTTGERHRFRERYPWELGQLADAKLKPGDVLEYYVTVTDNYDLGGQRHEAVSSGKLKITIISQETLSEIVTQQLRQVSDRVRQTQNAQRTTKQETTDLHKDTQSKPRLDGGDKTALARLAEQQSTLASRTKQIAGQVADIQKKLEENRSTNKPLEDMAKEVKDTLDQAAENAMNPASQDLNQAQQHAETQSGKPNDPKNQQQTQQRNQAMSQAEQNQQQAIDQLGKAMDKMSNLSTFEGLIQKVRDALAKQEDLSKQLNELSKDTLGKRPEDLTAEQKKNLENLANEQKKAAENTDKLTGDLEKAAQEQQKADQPAAQAMKQAAQQSRQQQVSQSQSQASQQAQQNQMASAQAKQKQAELGLRMMLDTMREAERRKLEQLAKELAKLQDLVKELIQRQAGHNIDNLRIQNTQASNKLITDDLLAKANRGREQQPAVPSDDQLRSFQGTTERKTRDYSKNAEDISKGGTEIAATLTKAAGYMEHATAVIKEHRLPEAFDPSQVRALLTLEDAAKKIDQALKEAQDQINDANKETIRQAYEKIRDEQKKVNQETTRIDSSKRLPDGSLTRVEAVNLGRLPGKQGELADRTKKLEEGLSAAGGIVYVWANKDIVDSMSQVKADLAKPATGVPTQAEQQRIVDQLDAMIKELAVKPHISDFKTPPGGGGGGGKMPPKPQLPSEAELRLLKDLQIAINASTKKIDALPDAQKDHRKLVGLGNRQGELRGLLDQLLQKASRGQVKLDPEPDPNEQKNLLPEEKGTAKIEDQELEDWLKNGKSGDDQMTNDVKDVGQRMARVKQRLALNKDPGKTTQTIEERIILNMDNLIKMAQQQQAQASSQPRPGQQPGQQPAQPQPGQNQGQQQTGVSQNNQGTNPASQETRNGTDDTHASGEDIREKSAEWGNLTPRERAAVIDGMQDKPIQKYKKLTDDYYEAMSKLGKTAEKK